MQTAICTWWCDILPERMREKMSNLLLYSGALLTLAWGIAHIIPVRGVVKSFEPVSEDNRRIILMEWLAEGLALCFIGALVGAVALISGPGNTVALLVYRLSAAMLICMAALTLFTGARTSILPMRLCPAVKTVAAVLILLGGT